MTCKSYVDEMFNNCSNPRIGTDYGVYNWGLFSSPHLYQLWATPLPPLIQGV